MASRNYSKGKIYKIVSVQTDKVYVGSTTKEYLSQRFVWHKSDFRKHKNGKRNDGMTAYQIMQYDDAQIVLIENYPCNDINELRARERHWIEQLDCVNKNIPSRTKQEYMIEYHNEKKDQIKAYRKHYNVTNKAKIAESVKLYSEQHSEDIKKYKAQTFQCGCGSSVSFGNKSQHIRTKKHQAFLEKNKEKEENQNDIKDE